VAPGATETKPVIVIGGGKVGCAATRSLRKRGVVVHMVEHDEQLRAKLQSVPNRLIIGDAADRDALMEAGLAEAPAVLLTTNDDAVNIYLSVYCRRLSPGIRIVSRITHSRNLEAIHRAGADFVLSYASLGVESVFSFLHGREPVILGGGVDYFDVLLPHALEGMTLAESAIGARTGLVVIAVKTLDSTTTNPPSSTRLTPGSRLLLLGRSEQHQAFVDLFGAEG
jgi:Trk K+ transport system NAD-binding subunit